MAMNYKFALKLHQDKAGSENAKAKITIGGTVVDEELEISPESATLYTYDVTGLADANEDGSATTLVKVELLNDYYVDADNDRDIIWSACGYVAQKGSGNYLAQTWVTDDNWETVSGLEGATVDGVSNKGVMINGSTRAEPIGDFTLATSFSWSNAGPVTGDENGEDGDYSTGWKNLVVSTDYVQTTVPLLYVAATTFVDNT